MKIITLGDGFVAKHLPYQRFTKKLPNDDLTFNEWVLDKYEPDVVINCIGKTGRPNVDWCEANKEDTYLANVTLPSVLAGNCLKRNIHFINIGSGCIYFGNSPHKTIALDQFYEGGMLKYGMRDLGWKETDFANPQSFYSQTKYACDLTIGSLPNVTTLRIRMPVSSSNDPRNFINKVRGYSRVIDIPNSMTIMDDLVRCVDWVIQNKKIGIYHVVNPQPITAAQVMREYQKYVPSHKFEVITEAELDAITIAKRSNCILNSEKLNSEGFFMTKSEDALAACMKKYIENINIGD